MVTLLYATSILDFHKLLVLFPGKKLFHKTEPLFLFLNLVYLTGSVTQHTPIIIQNVALDDCKKMSVHISKLFLRHNLYLNNLFTDSSCMFISVTRSVFKCRSLGVTNYQESLMHRRHIVLTIGTRPTQ